MVQRREHADRVLSLAREEADWFGHRYLGPEHVVLGVLRDGGSAASRVLEAHGVGLAAAREALGRLVDGGVVPGPRPSDAELLGLLGIDLDVIRQTTEQSFGSKAVGWVVGEATRARRRGVGRVPRTPLRDPPMLISQVLVHAASRPGRSALSSRSGVVAAGGRAGHSDALAQVHEQPMAAAAVCLGRPTQGVQGRRRAAAGYAWD